MSINVESVAQESGAASMAEFMRQQAIKDRDEAMSVLLARHGENLSTWPVHIRSHFERLQAAQKGCDFPGR